MVGPVDRQASVSCRTSRERSSRLTDGTSRVKPFREPPLTRGKLRFPTRHIVRRDVSQYIAHRILLLDVLGVLAQNHAEFRLVVGLIVGYHEGRDDDATGGIGAGESGGGLQEEDGARGEGEVRLGGVQLVVESDAYRERQSGVSEVEELA